MMDRNIDYKILLKNVEDMIMLLEFDSMRSSGKCKLNATTISDLYHLKDRYIDKIKKEINPKLKLEESK